MTAFCEIVSKVLGPAKFGLKERALYSASDSPGRGHYATYHQEQKERAEQPAENGQDYHSGSVAQNDIREIAP